jgi:hypothetical protein
MKTKIAVMVEEGVRRLRNHSQGMDSQACKECMVKWAKKLKRSGYPATFRHQVISAALGRWRRLCSDAEKGVRPIHRPREWRRKERRLAKEDKRSNWHSQPGQISAPLILDPVPGDMLDKLKTVCEKFEKDNGIKVKVCPRAGRSVKTDAKAEPLRKLGCDREDCLPCRSPGRTKGDCEKNSVTYKITCQTCLLDGKKTSYEGETGRNAFTRGVEHQQGLHSKSENSALWKHCVLEPDSQEAEFIMEIIQCHSTCLSRQVHEAVRILRTDAEIILNSKSEFHQTPLVRVVATNGLQEEQTSAASQGLGAAAGSSSQGRRGRGGRGGKGRAIRRREG